MIKLVKYLGTWTAESDGDGQWWFMVVGAKHICADVSVRCAMMHGPEHGAFFEEKERREWINA